MRGQQVLGALMFERQHEYLLYYMGLSSMLAADQASISQGNGGEGSGDGGVVVWR